MFYNEELIFIEMFMYSICSKGVKEIPFSNEIFNAGISALDTYLKKSMDDRQYSSIMNLFIKNPIYGEYNKIAKGIMNMNGKLCSFAIKNPVWETLVINGLKKEDAQSILELYSEAPFSIDMISQAVDKFLDKVNEPSYAN